MSDLVSELERRLREATARAFGPEFDRVEPLLRRSEHADYQANLALGLKDRLGRSPRAIADAIVKALDARDLCDRVDVAGPGFINLWLTKPALARAVRQLLDDERLGVRGSSAPDRVVVDYSAPNVAKEMHVGHIRSTVLGDALVRILAHAGHEVIPQNHLGDWGTPFGMLIEHLLDLERGEGAEGLSIDDLDAFYVEAREKFDGDPAFAERARRRVVLLQSGDADTLLHWRLLVEESSRHFQAIYEKLYVRLRPEDVRGESAYNDGLPGVIAHLRARGLLTESEGALCVFPEGFRTKEGAPLPLIVQKRDGGFGYAATDLAAVRYRTESLGATRLLYVVGAPQAQHFQMVFAVSALAGWLGPGVRAEHVAFGSILGAERKPLRTRVGGTVKLRELLEEAISRGEAQVRERQPDLDPETQARLGREIGIGAIKYADLSNERIKDYVFDWDRMLAAQGNTGPYLQYAHARIASIFRKAADVSSAADTELLLDAPEERALAFELLAFGSTVEGVVESLQVHRLCAYLYGLSALFMQFFEKCPVLRAESEALRSSRLALADGTRRVLETGLELLGIPIPERM